MLTHVHRQLHSEMKMLAHVHKVSKTARQWKDYMDIRKCLHLESVILGKFAQIMNKWTIIYNAHKNNFIREYACSQQIIALNPS